MTELKDKIAIVTGAAVGLGNAYAKALAKEGVNLAVCDIRPEINQVRDELAEMGVDCIGSEGDVSNPDFVKHFVDVTKSKFGHIDILNNNAGVWGASVADDDMEKTLEDVTDELAQDEVLIVWLRTPLIPLPQLHNQVIPAVKKCSQHVSRASGIGKLTENLKY